MATETHTTLTPVEETIAAYYMAHKGSKKYPERAMNRTEILEMLFGKGRITHPRAVSVAGRVLSDIIGKHRTISGKQRAWLIPFNEFAQDFSTWPENYQIKKA